MVRQTAKYRHQFLCRCQTTLQQHGRFVNFPYVVMLQYASQDKQHYLLFVSIILAIKLTDHTVACLTSFIKDSFTNCPAAYHAIHSEFPDLRTVHLLHPGQSDRSEVTSTHSHANHGPKIPVILTQFISIS